MAKKGVITRIGEVIDTYFEERQQEQSVITNSVPQQKARKRGRILRWFLPNGGTLLVVLLLIATQSVWSFPLQSPSATSTSTISYQGRLADAGGEPVTGLYNMEFRIYDVPASGTPLWEEDWTAENSVQVSDGLFNVMLGSINNTLASAIAGHDELYLGIAVGTDSEMSPRVQLGSVPYSFQAQEALTVSDDSITSAKIADGAVGNSEIANDAVGSSKIANDAVGSSEIADGAVTTAEMADRAVTSQKVVLASGQFRGTEHLVPTTSAQILPGVNFTVTVATNQIMLAYVTIDAKTSASSGTIVGYILVDGVSYKTPATVGITGDVQRSSAAGVAYVPLAPGTYTVQLAVLSQSDSGGIVYGGNSGITYFLFSQ